MKQLRLVLTLSLLALLASTGESFAVPDSVNFTARIADADGPVSGDVDLGFGLFDVATGGTEVWTESHEAAADRGLVFVELGSVTALDDTVFTGGELFLELTVNGDVMSPRISIGSVPYATRAGTADRLGDLFPEDVATQDHGHSTTDITNSTTNSGVMLHDCSWATATGASGTTFVTTTCPAGKFAISGGCRDTANSVLEMSKPHNSEPSNGSPPTAVSSWFCQYQDGSTNGYVGFALCCRY